MVVTLMWIGGFGQAGGQRQEVQYAQQLRGAFGEQVRSGGQRKGNYVDRCPFRTSSQLLSQTHMGFILALRKSVSTDLGCTGHTVAPVGIV